MFERFTDGARKVMELADDEAKRLRHEHLGTEHILLGLLREGSGVGANVLRNLDVDLKKARQEIEKLVKKGPEMVIIGRLPQTPRTKMVIEYAIEEARNLGHNYVGTEHLLLGLLRETDDVACQVLTNLGLQLEQVRTEVLKLLGPSEASTAEVAKANTKEPKLRPGEFMITCVVDLIDYWLFVVTNNRGRSYLSVDKNQCPANLAPGRKIRISFPT